VEARFKAAGFFGYWPLLSLPVPRPAPRWTQQPHAWVYSRSLPTVFFRTNILYFFYNCIFYIFCIIYIYLF